MFLNSENCVIKVQGVEVTEETPLFELWSLFAHGDLFLYLIVEIHV